MAQATWENSQSWEKSDKNEALKRRLTRSGGRWKFLVGGALILASIAYLIVSNTLAGARFFITVEEVTADTSAYIGETVRISGAVIGDTIEYDDENLNISFTIAHIPSEFDNLAEALHDAVNNPDAERLSVFVENEVKPDLLQHEAQAILTGHLGTDGVFYADELLLKCPSRFEGSGSNPALGEDHPGMSADAG